ncbi:hypothetical protein D3C72_2375240 [compost metagenome]
MVGDVSIGSDVSRHQEVSRHANVRRVLDHQILAATVDNDAVPREVHFLAEVVVQRHLAGRQTGEPVPTIVDSNQQPVVPIPAD